MNAEEASLLWNRKDEVDQIGGSAAHRQLALKHLKLKTVIKVSGVSGAYCMPTCIHDNLGLRPRHFQLVHVPSDQDVSRLKRHYLPFRRAMLLQCIS